ncbi:MAG: TetR family transcriptional regulator [Bacteroidota bacterium]
MQSTLEDKKALYFMCAKGLELFNKKGYQGTRISDICTTLSISKNAFTHYFVSKEDFFIRIAQNLILHNTFELLIEPISQNQNPFPLVLNKIGLELEKAVNSTDDQGFLLGNFINEFNREHPRINKCLNDILKIWEVNLTALLRKGQLDNYVSTNVDCEGVARYIISSYLGIRMQMVNGDSRRLADQYMDQLRYYFYAISKTLMA